MKPDELSDAVADAVTVALASSGHPVDEAGRRDLGGRVAVRPVEPPRRGDWATPVALAVAPAHGVDPRALADGVARALEADPRIASAEVTGPGFVTITLATPVGNLARRLLDPATPPLPLLADPLDADVVVRLRDGRSVTPRDLAAIIGGDAARFALARRPNPAADVPAIDAVRWMRRTPDNPVFTVQHAHARACRVDDLALEAGLRRGEDIDPALLGSAADEALLAALGQAAPAAARAVDRARPHHLTRALETIAEKAHAWHESAPRHPVVTPTGEGSRDQRRARLWLNDASRRVLADGLHALHVAAPTRI